MGLFMRPITPSSMLGVSNNLRRDYRTGGYRALLMGLLIMGLCLIGLYHGLINFTKICNNIGGRDPAGQDPEALNKIESYYPGETEGGLLGMLRMARRPPLSSGRDVE